MYENLNFNVIDFETANQKRESACSVGIVEVKQGIVTGKHHFLICPPELYFHPMCVSIHGINANDVRHEPHFDSIYLNQLYPLLNQQTVIAHNASFDMGVLIGLLDYYNLPYPEISYLCTVKVAKKIWPNLANHKLNTVSSYLNFPFRHHDALEDSLACGNILLSACTVTKCNDISSLCSHLGISKGILSEKGHIPCKKQR